MAEAVLAGPLEDGKADLSEETGAKADVMESRLYEYTNHPHAAQLRRLKGSGTI